MRDYRSVCQLDRLIALRIAILVVAACIELIKACGFATPEMDAGGCLVVRFVSSEVRLLVRRALGHVAIRMSDCLKGKDSKR